MLRRAHERSARGVNPFAPALAATFAASFGFMPPVATPQNAIVYGSGAVPITTMIRSGVTFHIAGAIRIVLLLPGWSRCWDSARERRDAVVGYLSMLPASTVTGSPVT